MGTQQGGSNVYPQSMFRAKISKISNIFQLNFQILQRKTSLCLTGASFRNENLDTEKRILEYKTFAHAGVLFIIAVVGSGSFNVLTCKHQRR